MPKSRQRCVTSLSISSKRAGVEEQIDALAGGELARLVLAAQALLAAAQLGAPLELLEVLDPDRMRQALTACAFSQSFRNVSRPMSVSGCLNSASMTAAGQVQMSAPMRAASTMCIGPRVEATSTSVLKS